MGIPSYFSHIVKNHREIIKKLLDINYPINNLYIDKNNLELCMLSKSDVWMDSGTFDSLNDASNYIKTFQSRQNTLIGCPEIASFNNGWITQDQIEKLVEENYKNSNLGKKIIEIVSLI